jgi:hypothetical protein
VTVVQDESDDSEAEMCEYYTALVANKNLNFGGPKRSGFDLVSKGGLSDTNRQVFIHGK